LHSLCEHWGDQGESMHRDSQRQALEDGLLDEDKQLDVLESLIRQARLRHGIEPTGSTPTGP